MWVFFSPCTSKSMGNDSAVVSYIGVNGGYATATWSGMDLQLIEPASVSTPVTHYNPLFGSHVGNHMCGDAYATEDSQDSETFQINGSFNVCSGNIPDLALDVLDTAANGNATTSRQILSKMERSDPFLIPPLMKNLPGGYDGCHIMDKNQAIGAWEVGRATIEVNRTVDCYLCKSTLPPLGTDSRLNDSELSSVISDYCIYIPCEDSELDSTKGSVCFKDDSGKFDCTTTHVPREIIKSRVYGTSSSPTTACGPMHTIGRAIATPWTQEVREAIL